MQKIAYTFLFLSLLSHAEEKPKFDLSPEAKAQIEEQLNHQHKLHKYKVKPPNSKKIHNAISVDGDGSPPAAYSNEMSEADMGRLMAAAKVVSNGKQRGLQGKAVTSILYAAGFTQEKISTVYSRDLGAHLEKIENGFEKIKAGGADMLDADKAPAGSVIVMSGGRAGSVYIKGNDGKYYSEETHESLPVKGRTITGIYYKRAGSKGILPSDEDEAVKSVAERLKKVKALYKQGN